ncbi:MAG: mechanosensitive ion channel domain-containing protein [Pseudomonadota bacterium]
MDFSQEDISKLTADLSAIAVDYGLSLLGALALIIVGFIVAGWARRATARALSRVDNIDPTLQRFLSSAVRYIVLVLVGVAVLNQFGIQTASLLAVLGAAGLAIGLALQGTLSDMAAGIMLLFFRPINVGDYVEAGGESGTVESIGLFLTELTTPDNVQVILANSDVWGTTVKNYSHHPIRRVDWTIGIGYGENMDDAMAAVEEVIAAEPRVLKDPEPQVIITNLGDSAVDLTIRLWTEQDNVWPIRWDLTKAFKEKLDARGIEIPFPQRTVHMVQEAAE